MKPIRHMRRAASAIAIAAVAALLAITGSAAEASARPLTTHAATARPLYNYGPWTVVNSPGTYDSSPNRSHSNGASVPARVTLRCYHFGAPAGPYGNTLWYQVGPGYGNWINDHYLDTPGTAAHPQPQTPRCPLASGTGIPIFGPLFSAENSPANMGNSPSSSWDVSNLGVSNNDDISLSCYLFGAPTGPYGNSLWYWAWDLNNNHDGWINDHYLNTPGTAANPQPQTPHC
jgi:hypothetical protein